MPDFFFLGSWPDTALAGLGGFLLFTIIRWVLATLRPKNFVCRPFHIMSHEPPGPPVVPGLGNLLQIPAQKPYLKFHAWAKQYGDLVSLKTGAGNLVVINNPAIVHELFDKRGSIYSNRPEMYVIMDHIFCGPEDKAIPVLQYDDYYRRWRKTFQFILSTAGIKKFMPLVEAEASNMSQQFLDDRSSYKDRVRAWSLAVPLLATTGQRLGDLPEGFSEEFFKLQEDFLKLMVPGSAPPVDVFPILKHVPEFWAKWKTEARRIRGIFVEDAWRLLVDGKRQRAQIEAEPGSHRFEGLIAKLLRERDAADPSKGRPFSDLELGYIGQALIGAAVDTTSATFESLMYCLAAFPEVLRKAQEEVDRVSGDAPPTGDHVNELPYLKACISEVLRWRPTTPSALPHTLTKDDRLGDFVFPKGTSFIANAWTIHRNEREYERPDDFVPERFLRHPHGLRTIKLTAEELEGGGRRALYTFGSGRRQCPGEQFAFTTIMLAASKVIWAFDVLPPEGGLDTSIETGYKDGTVTEPVDPTVVFRRRDEGRCRGLTEDARRTEAIARGLLG